MTDDRQTDAAAIAGTDLPMQPTGSGVADLAIANMQASVAEQSDADAAGEDGPTKTQA